MVNKEFKTPLQQLLKKLCLWCNPHATEENLQQIKKLMEESQRTMERVYPGKSYCLYNLVSSTKIPKELVNQVFDFLLERGADIHSKKPQGNLLHAAILGENSYVFDKALEAGVNPNDKNNWGDTPLHWAVIHNRAEYVKKLLDIETVRLFSVDERNKESKTPAELMSKNTDPRIYKLFRQLTWNQPQQEIAISSINNLHNRKRHKEKEDEYQPLLGKLRSTDNEQEKEPTIISWVSSHARKVFGL